MAATKWSSQEIARYQKKNDGTAFSIYRWMTFATVFLYPTGAVMDYLLKPPIWFESLVVRVLGVSLCLALYFLVSRRVLKLSVFGAVMTYFSIGASTQSVACILDGGYVSQHYIDLVMLSLAGGILYPYSGRRVALMVSPMPIIYAIAMLVAADFHIQDTFIYSNHIFMISMACLTTTLVAWINERVRREGFSKTLETERAKAALAQANERLRQNDELRRNFLANMSHELRTPVTLIMGSIDSLLASTEINTESRSRLETARRNTRLMLRNVNDLLEMAKLEVQKTQLRASQNNFSALVHNVAAFFEQAAREKAINYQIDAPETCIAEVDADKMQHVLVNLLSNAFKFTPHGGVVSCRLECTADTVSFEVRDNGPGVKPEERQSVFERFRQGDAGRDRKFGTGLGLAIAKEFVDLHHGTIEVKDAEGGGAIFVVRVPVQRPREEGVVEQPPIDYSLADIAADSLKERKLDFGATTVGNAPQVLVVDDNIDVQKLLFDTLRSSYRVELASNGIEGIAKALSLHPDVIVTDIMMPKLAGDVMVREIRSKHHELDDVPILLLSARADDDMRIDLLRAGAQDYITKPFLAEELLARLGNLVSAKKARDLLQGELEHKSGDLAVLARDVVLKKKEIEIAKDSLEIANQAAERALAIKADFLSVISHELNTPLTSIKIGLEVLTRKRLADIGDSQYNKLLNSMVMSSDRLKKLIQTTIEFTAAQSRGFSPMKVKVDLRALIADVVDALKTQAELKEIELLVRIESDAESLVSDARLLRVALMNLVQNAIKFTDRGQVLISSARIGNQCKIDVVDTGKGVPLDRQAEIFEPFVRLETTLKKHEAGFGLGLPLVKRIVTDLGGQIEVSSNEKVGSRFSILLPLFVDTSH